MSIPVDSRSTFDTYARHMESIGKAAADKIGDIFGGGSGGKVEKPGDTPFVQGSGDGHAVDPDDVRQNGYGSCGVLSTLQSIAQQDPDAIRNMVQDNGDGTYTVTFQEPIEVLGIRLGSREVEVTVSGPFDGGAAHDSGDVNAQGQTENWPAIVEVAYAKQYKSDDQTYTTGVNPADVMERVLGSGSTTQSPGDIGFEQMGDKLASGEAVVAWTSDISSPERAALAQQYGVSGGHAYSVTSTYTAADGTQMVRLSNPWGTNHVDMPYADYQKLYHEVNSAPTR